MVEWVYGGVCVGVGDRLCGGVGNVGDMVCGGVGDGWVIGCVVGWVMGG